MISLEEDKAMSGRAPTKTNQDALRGWRHEVLDTLASGVTVEDLERIAKTMPFILQEAVRELNGEVRYEQIETCCKGIGFHSSDCPKVR